MTQTLHTKSKDECWAEFWSIIGPALVDAYRDGRITEWPGAMEVPAAA